MIGPESISEVASAEVASETMIAAHEKPFWIQNQPLGPAGITSLGRGSAPSTGQPRTAEKKEKACNAQPLIFCYSGGCIGEQCSLSIRARSMGGSAAFPYGLVSP